MLYGNETSNRLSYLVSRRFIISAKSTTYSTFLGIEASTIPITCSTDICNSKYHTGPIILSARFGSCLFYAVTTQFLQLFQGKQQGLMKQIFYRPRVILKNHMQYRQQILLSSPITNCDIDASMYSLETNGKDSDYYDDETSNYKLFTHEDNVPYPTVVAAWSQQSMQTAKVPDPVYTTTLAPLLAAFTYNQKILQSTTLLGHFLTVSTGNQFHDCQYAILCLPDKSRWPVNKH